MRKIRITRSNVSIPQKDEIRKKIVACFQKDAEASLTPAEVAKRLEYHTRAKVEKVEKIVRELFECGVLSNVKTGFYKLNTEKALVEGELQRNSKGRLFILAEGDASPIYVAGKNAMHSLDGDRVKVQVFKRKRGGDMEGEVVELIARSSKERVGVVKLYNGAIVIDTADRYAFPMARLPHSNLRGANPNDKVTFLITDWGEFQAYPTAVVQDILGKDGDNTTEMHAILVEYGLPYRYPDAPVEAANRIRDDLNEKEFAKREDFREVLTFTIDPVDAKDFDDALSIRPKGENVWEVGVHIADVTHYVKPNSVIDNEAYERATSVYLVDRTIPMLPERLSNELCSLRPNEEKLCFSVVFDINDRAEVLSRRIVKTIIKSNRRFNYGEVQNIIETGEGDYAHEIQVLNGMAKILREERFKNGAINFDRFEVKFNLDDKGKPLGVFFKYSQEANHLIEEFMLLANRTVAETIGKIKKGDKKRTFVYRVHDQPSMEKLEPVSLFVRKMGYNLSINGTKKEVSKSLNQLLGEVSGKREESLIENICLKAMCKAIYSTLNIGHYGLAFEYYTHFTSPIRRYPDMMVHRLLERYLLMDGGSVPADKYEEFCEHCSDMEQLSVAAERASVKYKQVEFMQDKLGSEYEGTISGVNENGLFVEIDENKCEGWLSIRDLEQDYYEYDKENYCLIGGMLHKTYRIGDPIKIRVVETNLEKRLLVFSLADKKETPNGKWHRRRH